MRLPLSAISEVEPLSSMSYFKEYGQQAKRAKLEHEGSPCLSVFFFVFISLFIIRIYISHTYFINNDYDSTRDYSHNNIIHSLLSF